MHYPRKRNYEYDFTWKLWIPAEIVIPGFDYSQDFIKRV